MKFTALLLLLIVLAVSSLACSKQDGFKAIQIAYTDCEIVADWRSDYGYFVRKPDGSVYYVISEGFFSGIKENIELLNQEQNQVLIFKAQQ